MLIKPTDIIYLPFPGLMVPNRDFNMPWHRWQWEHQKTIGFISKTLLFCTCMMLVCTFLCTFLHDYDVKMPNFMLYGVRKQATTKFYFSFWTRMDMVLRKSTPGGFNYIILTKKVGRDNRDKDWKNINSLLSDVLIAVMSLDYKVPTFSRTWLTKKCTVSVVAPKKPQLNRILLLVFW